MSQKKHLYEIDLMRAFIMLCVLTVHTIAFYMGIESVHSAALLSLGSIISALHYTREAFMFITGLVLFVTYYHRDFHPFQFWRKRLVLVAIPYVVWTLAYILFKGTYEPHFDWSVASLGKTTLYSLAVGNQFYLYYVLVSIQLYIVFPLLLYGVKKFEKRHLHIFIGSLLVQLAVMYIYKFDISHVSWSRLPFFLGQLVKNRDTLIVAYQFWFIAGGILACHYQRVLGFVERHRKALFIAVPISTLVVASHYLFDRLVMQESESLSHMVLQPIMVPYSLLAASFMWYLGVLWARRRTRPQWNFFSRYIQVASTTSFGIYLLQPFSLYVMRVAIEHLHAPRWVHFATIPVSVLFVYFSAMLAAYWIGKVPYIAYCVGQKVKFNRSGPGGVTAAKTA